jgi:2,4-dienoyl-CoA reductase-like NADH-dependent reductase (Old Yellow Enzyme family)
MAADVLFEPFTFKDLSLKNRVVMEPLTRAFFARPGRHREMPTVPGREETMSMTEQLALPPSPVVRAAMSCL